MVFANITEVVRAYEAGQVELASRVAVRITEHEIIDNPTQPLWLFGLCIEPRIWQHETGFLQKLGYGRRTPRPEVALNFRAYLRRILFEQTHPTVGHILRIAGITQQFLGELLRLSPYTEQSAGTVRTVAPTSQQRVSDYVSQLTTTFYEPDSINQVATKLQLSRRRFTTLFREITGASWAQYVTRLRLEYAQQLLKETNRTIESIAFETGYEELSGFYRAFRREVGMSPTQFRETTISGNNVGQKSKTPPIVTGGDMKTWH
jgi:AraC family L-rhamnose operon regulatory protein RhaS